VQAQLGNRIPLIVDGGTTPRVVASTIVDLTDEENGWRIIRAGAISTDEIMEVLG
jgi:tRNA A37 threonylcarbamoyladenosine synthetase subunit TsaC/SUA5/YrdC